jgi:uncharacterized membrane protein
MQSQVPTSDVTSDDKLWTLLAYLLSPVVPIIILLMQDKKDRPFIKAHNIQALVWGVVAYVVMSIGYALFVVPGCIVSIGYIILTIMWAIKANKGEYVTIPVITNFVKNQGWA